MRSREWLVGDTNVDKLYIYTNLDVLKNYVGSFSINFEDNINKLVKKFAQFLHLVLFVAKLILSFTLYSGDRHVCHCYCLCRALEAYSYFIAQA